MKPAPKAMRNGVEAYKAAPPRIRAAVTMDDWKNRPRKRAPFWALLLRNPQ